MKKSAEAAAETGEILGEPYTPPGRTAVFDIPSYDDIADLHELFKRFANTTAGVSEAGLGGLVDKTASFNINDVAQLGQTYVCTSTAIMDITIGDGPAPTNGWSEGARFNVVQGGSGKVQIVGSNVIGATRTTGQYEGLTAVVHGGKWWCLPFGSSSGGGDGGPIQIVDTAADLTVNASHMGALIACDTSAKVITITMPLDDGTIPIGAATVVSNVGAGANKARVVGASGVVVQDRAAASVGRYQSVSLVKRKANVWLINAGGGNSGGSAPTQPQNAKAYGTPGSILVTWEVPSDDGGHSITSYVIEHGESAGALTQQKIVSGDQLTASIDGLTVGKAHFARVKAVNVVGASEPTTVVSATPTQDYNVAEGGTVTDYSKDGKFFRVHTFTKSDVLVVKNATNPFRVVVCGGGGGGGGSNNVQHGGGGGGGKVYGSDSQVLSVKSYAVAIGPGGPGGAGNDGGRTGTATTFGEFTGDGGSGGQPNCSMCSGSGGGNYTSDISGSSYTYGADAPFHDQGQITTYGAGGWGGDAGTNVGRTGMSGVVVVSYEIAPFNSATGGEESDYFDSKTGAHYKVHKFTANDVFKVKAASRPFRIFVQGGGAGGGYRTGGGRGAANDAEFNLTVQDYTITVGAAVSGGYSEYTNRDAPGNNGNRSAVEGVVSSPGGISRGDYYAAGVTTDITGTPVTYGGAGGNCVINEDRNEGGFPGGGLGGSTATSASVTGGGGGGCQWNSGGGARGEVIISYEIAK